MRVSVRVSSSHVAIVFTTETKEDLEPAGILQRNNIFGGAFHQGGITKELSISVVHGLPTRQEPGKQRKRL